MYRGPSIFVVLNLSVPHLYDAQESSCASYVAKAKTIDYSAVRLSSTHSIDMSLQVKTDIARVTRDPN